MNESTPPYAAALSQSHFRPRLQRPFIQICLNLSILTQNSGLTLRAFSQFISLKAFPLFPSTFPEYAAVQHAFYTHTLRPNSFYFPVYWPQIMVAHFSMGLANCIKCRYFCAIKTTSSSPSCSQSYSLHSSSRSRSPLSSSSHSPHRSTLLPVLLFAADFPARCASQFIANEL
jgi:hypothetical protein